MTSLCRGSHGFSNGGYYAWAEYDVGTSQSIKIDQIKINWIIVIITALESTTQVTRSEIYNNCKTTDIEKQKKNVYCAEEKQSAFAY